jgi:hypothetical protein
MPRFSADPFAALPLWRLPSGRQVSVLSPLFPPVVVAPLFSPLYFTSLLHIAAVVRLLS